MSFDLAIVGNDLKILPSGEIKTVSGTPKLKQDVLKIVITQLGTNKFHPWYGCSITDDSIGMDVPENMMVMDIESSITDSIDRLIKLQAQQSSQQNVSLSELITMVGSVNIFRDSVDFRKISIEIIVYSKELEMIKETLTLTL